MGKTHLESLGHLGVETPHTNELESGTNGSIFLYLKATLYCKPSQENNNFRALLLAKSLEIVHLNQ